MRDLKSAACENMLTGVARRFSIEVTPRDQAAMQNLGEILPAKQEVFIACLPADSMDTLIAAAAKIQQCGMSAVPHIVARNITGKPALATALQRLSQEAGDQERADRWR